MAKKKEEFNLDDWSFDSDLDFGDFDIEPGQVKKDRNPSLEVAKSVAKGAKDTVLSPNAMKDFLKKSLPKEYGSTMSTVESGMTLGKGLYNDIEKEIRPVVQEAKRFGKKLLPSMKTYLPDGLSSRLEQFLDTQERSANSGPSKEELEDATIASQIADIFKVQAKAEDQRRKEETLDQYARDTIAAKRHKEGISVQHSMAKNIAKLAQYQDKVTINWQRKTLELQYRQYFLQREAFEEQKKTAAIIQTNLEGILKNTALPDFVKLNKMEAGMENIRNRILNSTLDGFFEGRQNFLRDFASNLRKNTVNRVREFSGQIRDGFGMLDMLSDSIDMADDMGMSKKGMLGGMVGGTLGNIGINQAAKRARRWAANNPRVMRAGHNLARMNRNMYKYITDAAREGKGEGIPVLGGLLSLIYETSQQTLGRDTATQLKAKIDPNEATFFDNRTKRTINDIIPGYLARILQANEGIAGRLGVDLKSVPHRKFDWKTGEFITKESIRRKILSKTYNKDERRDFTKDWSSVIDKMELDIMEDEDIENVRLNKEQKDLLIGKLISMQLRDESYDPYQLQDEDFWSNVSAKDAKTFSKFFKAYLGEAKDKGIVPKKRTDRAKYYWKQLTEDQGYSASKANRLDAAFQNIGKNIRTRKADIQQLIDDGHEHLLQEMGIIDKNGNIREKEMIRGFYRGYKDTGVFENGSSALNVSVNHIKTLDQINALTPEERTTENATFRKLSRQLEKEQQRGKKYRRANGGFIPRDYANGGQVQNPYSGMYTGDYSKSWSGYTGYGSKWAPKDINVHGGEVVWSQEDIARFGGVLNVEAIRKFGRRALNNILKNPGENIGGTTYQTSDQMTDLVTEIRDILLKGIPVSGFTDKGINPEEVPWYLRSFGSVIGDIASLPFRVANGMFSNSLKAGRYVKNKISSLLGKGIDGGKKLWSKARERTLNLTDKYADKFDVWIKGEVKPRLTKFSLKNGEYYNSKGEQITSWKQIDKDGVFKLSEDGRTWETVLNPGEIYSAFVINYETGKNIVLNSLTKVKDFGKRRVEDLLRGSSLVRGLAVDTVKAGYQLAKNQIYKAEDVYIKDRVAEGPRLLAIVMRKGHYYSQYGMNKQIFSPADIEGPVVDAEGNLVLTHEDIKAGLVDKNNKPLRVGLGKITGFIGDVARSGFNAVMGFGRNVRNASKSLFGGVKNFFASFFGDGGVIFANSNKLVDKLDLIYKLLDVRIPLPKGITRGDKDGDGDRDGSVKDLRERNKLAALSRKEKEILKRKEMQERMQKVKDKFGNTTTNALEKGGGLLDTLKEKIFGGEDEGGDIYIDAGDRKGRRKSRGDIAKQKARIARKRAARRLGGLKGKGLGALGGIRGRTVGGLGRMASLGSGIANTGGVLLNGAKGLGVGAALGIGAAGAHATGLDGVGTLMEYGSAAASIYSLGSMATGLFGGSLAGLGSAALGGITTAGGAVLGGLGSAGAFLLTNPVGWAVLGGAALAGLGYLGYKLFKGSKQGPLATYRYVQYGFPEGKKDWLSKIGAIEEWFEKDKVAINGNQVEIKDTKVNFNEFFGLFDTDMKQREQCLKVLKWYNERFKPVFSQHVLAASKIKAGTKLADVDSKLSGVEKLRYLAMVEYPQGPYEMHVSPFADLPSLPSGTAEVKTAYQNAKNAVGKDVSDKDKATVAATAVATTTATTAVASALTKPSESRTASATTTTPTANKAFNVAAATTAGVASMSVITSQASDSVDVDGKIPALKAVRLKAYGLTDFEVDRVTALVELENAILKNITLTSGNKAQYRGDVNKLAAQYASTFGISTNDVVPMVDFENYLANRFIPVLLAQVSTVSKLTNRLDVSQTLQENLSAKQALATAQAVVGAKGEQGSVWLVGKGLWLDYALNTDSKSTSVHINALKAKLSDKALVSEGAETSISKAAAASTAVGLAAGATTRAEQERTIRQANETAAKAGGASEQGFFSKAIDSMTGRLGKFVDSLKSTYAEKGLLATAGEALSGISDNGFLGGAMQTISNVGNLIFGNGSGGDIKGVPQPTGNGWQHNKNTITAAAKMIGIDPGVAAAMAAIESAFRPSVKAGTSSAGGLYQFIDSTWNMMMKKYAGKFGIPKGTSKYNGAANALLGMQFTKDNYDELKKISGTVSVGDLYLAHFMGVGGAKKMISANQNAIAAQLFPKEARANKSIFFQGGRALTIAEVRQELERRVYKAHASHKVDIPINGTGSVVGKAAGASMGATAGTAIGGTAIGGMLGNGLVNKGSTTQGGVPMARNVPTPTASTGNVGGFVDPNRIPSLGRTQEVSRSTANPWTQHKGNQNFSRNTGGYVQEPSTQEDPVAKGNVPANSRAARAAQVASSRAKGRSSGYCARYVADALAAGGYKFQRQPSAYMYANGTLAQAGFKQIPLNSPPQVGDVMVWPAHGGKGGGGKHGHIQIFTGSAWVSDFRQPNVVPGGSYRRVRPSLWRDAAVLSNAKANPLAYAGNNPAVQATQGTKPTKASISKSAYAGVNNAQTLTGVPNADKLQSTWEDQRTNKTVALGQGTLLENLSTLAGSDSLAEQNKAIRTDVQNELDNKRNQDVVSILADSNKEHKTTNRLLGEIHKAILATSRTTQPTEKPLFKTDEEVALTQREELVTKNLFGQKSGTMSGGKLKVAKKRMN